MARATLPMDPGIRELVEAAEAIDWPSELTGSGHWKITTPTRGPIYLPSTPSDWRSVLNCRAELKRAGLTVTRRDKQRKVKEVNGSSRPSLMHIPRNLNFNSQRFGAALIEEMRSQNLNQEDLAAKLEVTGGQISLWKRGMGRPSMENLVRIMKELGWADPYGKKAPLPVPEPEPMPVPEPVEAEVAAEVPEPQILDPRQLLLEPVVPETLAKPKFDDQMPYLRAVDGLNQIAGQNRDLRNRNAQLEQEISILRDENARKNDIIAGLQDEIDRLNDSPQSSTNGRVLQNVKVQIS